MSSSPSGGLYLNRRMKDILSQPGYLGAASGGQELRGLYRQESIHFDPTKLSEFGLACYCGVLDAVERFVETNSAPDLEGTETPFKWGYATLVVLGAQRVVEGPPGSLKHAQILKYLLSRGVPIDSEDIVGMTALHHTISPESQDVGMMRLLLECGANVDHQDRYGSVVLFGALQRGQVEPIDVLMEFGADLTIAEADGIVPMKLFSLCGPHVTATVTKWIRKRSGEAAPREEKRCDSCGRSDGVLKNCAKCKVARYCTVECQRKHWPTHKQTCQPFAASNTVVLRPFYENFSTVLPAANLVRNFTGIPTPPTPKSHSRGAHTPKSLSSESKDLIIKVQVPFDRTGQGPAAGDGDLFVYTKKRDFVCIIRRADRPAEYDRISNVVRTKGVHGVKAYFAAESKNKDELVVKISEVLAEQPF